MKKILVQKDWKKPDDLSKIYRETAEILAIHKTGIEINTRGMVIPEVGEYYPDIEFLKYCAKMGVFLTMGSDSHDGGSVGEGFEPAVRYAMEAGYKKLSICHFVKLDLSGLQQKFNKVYKPSIITRIYAKNKNYIS